jgi:hypothetical protein
MRARMSIKRPENSALIAMLEFTESGYLKTVYLCVSDDRAQKALESAIGRLIKPPHWGWFRRLFRRW